MTRSRGDSCSSCRHHLRGGVALSPWQPRDVRAGARCDIRRRRWTRLGCVAAGADRPSVRPSLRPNACYRRRQRTDWRPTPQTNRDTFPDVAVVVRRSALVAPSPAASSIGAGRSAARR